MYHSLKLHIKRVFLISILAILGGAHAVHAQEIVIHDLDSSWKNEEIPAKQLAKKKYSLIRRFFQNTTTRYNFYFNSKETLNQAIARARNTHQDNYDSILSIYPYRPKDFKSSYPNLDSVIKTAGIGIQIHDPRSKWVKQLYLLVGKAHFYKQEYSEAIKTFKYMIQHLRNKKDEQQSKVIGTRSYQSEKNISVMRPEEKEKRYPLARNDAFIWLVRAYLKQKNEDRATTLMSTLTSDPNLPERLRSQLYVIKAVFYKQKKETQKTITALSSAIPLQKDKELKARWQFILSQLYAHHQQWEKAIASYHRVKNFKPYPLMKFYAELNPILIQAAHGTAGYEQTKSQVLKIAKKRKFAHYKSIIYQYLGELAIKNNHPNEGIAFLKKSLKYNQNDKETHTKSGLLLAHYYYNNHQYRLAKKYYDEVVKTSGHPDSFLKKRQEGLSKIVKNLDIIQREDSLQHLAELPKDSLYFYLNSIVEDSIKAYKKRNLVLSGGSSATSSSLLSHNQDISPNEHQQFKGSHWYFYNNNAKARGYNEFKKHWGNRSLEDNWRWSNPNAHTSSSQRNTSNKQPILSSGEVSNQGKNTEDMAKELLQKLTAPIPLTETALQNSNKKTSEAYHKIINTFYVQLEDDSTTLYMIHHFLDKQPENEYLPDIYYKFYLIYNKLAQKKRAAHYKQLLLSQYPDSKYAEIFRPQSDKKQDKELTNVTEKLYNEAYKNYLSKHYKVIPSLRDSALKLNPENKQKARFDLLNAMSLIKTKSVDAGVVALHQTIESNPSDTLIIKRAQLILKTIKNKKSLITHIDSLPAQKEIAQTTDSVSKDREKIAVSNPSKEQKENHVEKEKPEKPKKKEVKDSIETKKEVPYKLDRKTPHFVILFFKKTNTSLLQKVEKAFTTYNEKKHAKDSILVSPYVLKHNQLILIFRTFKNEKTALKYYSEIKEKASYEIIPKIEKSDYRFFFISRDNFILLNNSQDIKGYLSFFHQHFK